MAMLEASSAFNDFPIDQDDVVYPCKGCGEILEEGKAFELAGNRWHIDCFRCNTCGLLLDSDANLLLLGDGSLICNNCTYSCSACGNKIEDLAILTGDQAFCANCFKCRNCKRKIDNLRYARTSQGIFCMSCHESLMARRRKNKRANRNPTPAPNGLNKSLPDLPRGDKSSTAFAPGPDEETASSELLHADSSEKTPSEMSPRPRQSKARKEASMDRTPVSQRVTSASSIDESRKETLTLPASTFQGSRESTLSKKSAPYNAANGEDFFGTVPLLLDTNQNPIAASPASDARDLAEGSTQSTGTALDTKSASRNHLGRSQPSITPARDAIRESQQGISPSSSFETKRATSPHIAHQQKARRPSDHIIDSMRKQKDAVTTSSSPLARQSVDGRRPTELPVTAASYPTLPSMHEFRLQEAPKTKRNGSRRSSKSADKSPTLESPAHEAAFFLGHTPQLDLSLDSPPSRMDDPTFSYGTDELGSSTGSQFKDFPHTEHPLMERPKRGDSLAASSAKGSFTRKEVGASSLSSGHSTPTPPTTLAPPVTGPLASQRATHDDYQPTSGAVGTSTKQMQSPSIRPVAPIGTTGPDGPPPRASSRPKPAVSSPETNPAPPHAPPPAPPVQRHNKSASASTVHTDSTSRLSHNNLPRHSTGAEFSLEEEVERVMTGGEKNESGALRKISQAVKHGRSFSDRGAATRSTSSPQKWPKSPLNGSIDISSPTSATSPDPREENIHLRNQVRQAQQRVAKLEVERSRLQGMVDGSADISRVNTELKQKRSTMAVLDTQREIVIRELDVMTDSLKKAKETNQALDLTTLKSHVLHDFAVSLQRLKESMGLQIEELMDKRNELDREINDLIQMKDKGFHEYEALSSRNLLLKQNNSELIASIQGNMKSVAQTSNGAPVENCRPAPNGLGLYIQQNKERSESGSEVRTIVGSEYSTSNLLQDNDSDGTILATPQVVKIGKGRPNMLKKGTQGFVKGLRTIRGNMVNERTERSSERNNSGQWVEGTPYNQIPVQPDSNSNLNLNMSRSYQEQGQGRQKFTGFFASEKPDRSHPKHLKSLHNVSNPNLAGDPISASQLFGSDLSSRCEYEKRVIPCIVSRCIEEVELRGMDVEGVYRKSGGSGQVNTVRSGFERDNDFDISDPDLDIHAVTSTLKQYFRRLPVPLITFDVYDQLLEASRIEPVDKRAMAMRDSINELPKSHKDCLEFLVFHLAKVMSHEVDNLMTPLNLAVVFAPTIMRPLTIEREMTDMQSQRIAVQSLLEMNQSIFGYED